MRIIPVVSRGRRNVCVAGLPVDEHGVWLHGLLAICGWQMGDLTDPDGLVVFALPIYGFHAGIMLLFKAKQALNVTQFRTDRSS